MAPRPEIACGDACVSWRGFETIGLSASDRRRGGGSCAFVSSFGRGITQSDWVKELKRVSSRWIKERDGRMAGFAWQGGYGVFSVSPSVLEAVEQYIGNRKNITGR